MLWRVLLVWAWYANGLSSANGSIPPGMAGGAPPFLPPPPSSTTSASGQPTLTSTAAGLILGPPAAEHAAGGGTGGAGSAGAGMVPPGAHVIANVLSRAQADGASKEVSKQLEHLLGSHDMLKATATAYSDLAPKFLSEETAHIIMLPEFAEVAALLAQKMGLAKMIQSKPTQSGRPSFGFEYVDSTELRILALIMPLVMLPYMFGGASKAALSTSNAVGDFPARRTAGSLYKPPGAPPAPPPPSPFFHGLPTYDNWYQGPLGKQRQAPDYTNNPVEARA